MVTQFALQIVRSVDSAFQGRESDRAWSVKCVRLADDSRFCDSHMTHQRALDLRRAEPVPGDIKDVVDAPDDPKISILIASRTVAGEIILFVFAPVLFFVALRITVNRPQHRRPRTSNN